MIKPYLNYSEHDTKMLLISTVVYYISGVGILERQCVWVCVGLKAGKEVAQLFCQSAAANALTSVVGHCCCLRSSLCKTI